MLGFFIRYKLIVSVNSFLRLLEGFIVFDLFCSRFFQFLDLLALILFNLRLRLFKFWSSGICPLINAWCFRYNYSSFFSLVSSLCDCCIVNRHRLASCCFASLFSVYVVVVFSFRLYCFIRQYRTCREGYNTCNCNS